eukprot:Ihof_evm3s26 gene=Ihof_evmTU3s26
MQETVLTKGTAFIDFSDLVDSGDIDAPSRHDIHDEPIVTFNCMGLAIYQIVHTWTIKEQIAPPEERINVRLFNYEPVIALKNMKSHSIGKYVAVQGTVVRVSNIRPMVTQMAFSCNMCGTGEIVRFIDGKYDVPRRCVGDQCKGKTFIPDRLSADTITIDAQSIRLQEVIPDSRQDSGRIPRTLDCELTGDLVDAAVPGDVVTVCGEVKLINCDEGQGKGNRNRSSMFIHYMLVNSISSNKSSETGSETLDLVEYSLKDLYAIQAIHTQAQLFKLIVNSLCPSIFGHELVKAGLLISLFGSPQKFTNDRNRIPVRGDIHVLVVGDPGLGKSQMLKAVHNISPRAVYVCGNSTSTAGLTVTLSKNGDGSGDYALEAGALVLADHGCCCIDEFDKMPNEHQALLEAMEQQCISIAKAGIVCSLPARCAIIAAANPVGGHYNKAKTVSENLRMSPALLSRFDLIFILLDKPNQEMDKLLSEHVMALHVGNMKAFKAAKMSAYGNSQPEPTDDDDITPLTQRLKIAPHENLDLIPARLLRKYIAYARKYVHPKLSSAAREELQDFYIKLREDHQQVDSTPITTRQLESLIRLAEARARVELREVVTREDALDVIQIMKYSLFDTYSDGNGNFDFSRSQMGTGTSKKAEMT